MMMIALVYGLGLLGLHTLSADIWHSLHGFPYGRFFRDFYFGRYTTDFDYVRHGFGQSIVSGLMARG